MVVFRAVVGLDITFEALLLWFSLSSEECLGIILAWIEFHGVDFKSFSIVTWNLSMNFLI